MPERTPELVDTKGDALRRLQGLIPSGAEVMTGSSTTLNQIGFTDLLKSGKHPWKNWKYDRKTLDIRKRNKSCPQTDAASGE